MRFQIFSVGYLLWHFVVEFIKSVWVLPVGISVIQLAVLAGLLYCISVWWPNSRS